MDITAAFNTLQGAANADPKQVTEARRRRDLFKTAFTKEADVVEVVPSGSLARSTQRAPINDVDVIIVFDSSAHPDWGSPGESASDALSYTGKRVNALLGATSGSAAQAVRLARPGNHAVKCFLDDPNVPGAFTVDAMPALRQEDGTLLIPEKASSGWVYADPEHLIEQVNLKQKASSDFRPLVRVLKMWKDEANSGLKSLTIEVLALEHLPPNLSRPKAIQQFFTAAEVAVESPITDPAGLCGSVQSSLDIEVARAALSRAASASWKAVVAQDRGDTDEAACYWHEVFGDAFPRPADGCPDPASESPGLPFNVGVGIGTTRPRPVADAPQGSKR